MDQLEIQIEVYTQVYTERGWWWDFASQSRRNSSRLCFATAYEEEDKAPAQIA